MSHSSKPLKSLPLVVQLGFSGSRNFFRGDRIMPEHQREKFDEIIEAKLTRRLERLPADLKLAPHHFLCGISQIAVGGDTHFTKACGNLALPQRLFLPQHAGHYLNAEGSRGPDFSPEQITIARRLIDAPHIIQERIVSDAPDRPNRFHDTQLELIRVSDVLICLIADGLSKPDRSPEGFAPGSAGLLDLAIKHHRPVLEIRVRVDHGIPEFHETWHHRERFRIPSIPHELDGIDFDHQPAEIPTITAYVSALQNSGCRIAESKQSFFKNAALFIIGAHLLATICAVAAMIFHHPPLFTILLIVELICLGGSFAIHRYLHDSHACRIWAVSRVVAEIARSVHAITDHHVYLSHLFQLPFPKPLRPLLRTLNVLHLRSASRHDTKAWSLRRDAYIEARLRAADGQLRYNERTHRQAAWQLGLAQKTFVFCSLAALASTSLKLLHFGPPALLGSLAIILPVLAVGALSLAAAFDLEARHNTSDEILGDLADLEKALVRATSEREFTRLLLETEARLLGETANWFSRRSFTGIA